MAYKVEIHNLFKFKGKKVPKILIFQLQEKRVHQIRCATRKRQKEDQSHAKLDILFLMLFPLFFLVFNVIYWVRKLYSNYIIEEFENLI